MTRLTALLQPGRSCGLVVLMLGCVAAGRVSAQDCPLNTQPLTGLATQIVVSNGPAEGLIDLVLVGDGYAQAELPKFRADVQRVIDYLFGEPPFREYASYFNVHRVEVVSGQSGTDRPDLSPRVCVDTALNTTQDHLGVTGCLNTPTPERVAQALANARTPDDIVLVLVNDPTRLGGCTTSVAVGAMLESDAGPAAIAHELGHLFGLADESVIGTETYTGPELVHANVTTKTTRADTKWAAWIDAATPLPTSCPSTAVGLFEGAAVDYARGLFRPTCTSKMSDIFEPWREVNTEALIKRFYTFGNPLAGRSVPITRRYPDPEDDIVVVKRGLSQEFWVEYARPTTNDLNVAWFIDGQQLATGPSLRLATNQFSRGSHQLTAVASDPTTWIRGCTDDFIRRCPVGPQPEGRTDWTVFIDDAIGDLNGDGAVTIDELVRAVSIALGTLTPSPTELAAIDNDDNERVTIDELILAATNALAGPDRAALDPNGDRRLEAVEF